MDSVRLDKWLWAARFFKTRSLAKQATEGGKIRVDGQRPKVGKELTVGMSLLIRRGQEEYSVSVDALSDSRGPASVAQRLYSESAASVEQREQQRVMRKAVGIVAPQQRPDKHSRRQLQRLKRSQ